MTKASPEIIELRFPKLNHFWLDSGVLGLYKIIKDIDASKFNVSVLIHSDGIVLSGLPDNIESLLKESYQILLKRYYNKSTQKQIQENSGFYYDSTNDRFVRFPKVKSMGIAGLIFSKAPRPTTDKGIKFEDKKSALLPSPHSHLQEKLNNFLKETGLTVTTSELLVDGPNAVQPLVDISVKTGKVKGRCFLCGESSHLLNEIGGTVFPFISGSSGVLGFNTLAGSPEKVCWKCDYVSKFVPVSGFYICNDGSFQIFFPYSSDLNKMNDVYGALHAAEYEDPYLMRNFDHSLGGYFQKPFELIFAFLYTLYLKVLARKVNNEEKDEYEMDFEKLFEITLSKAPLEFIVMHTEALGETQMGKMVWPFQDSVYFFRLIDRLRVNIKEVMQKLIDYEQPKNENKSLMRNRICERILKKQSTLDLIEKHAFHICKSKDVSIAPIFDFVLSYETILKEGGNGMEQAGVDAAVKLGKRIGASIANAQNGKKGDLFALRKARKIEDFLNEVNRVQFKYNVSVPTEIYEGYLNRETFAEFKQFCMIAALNTYNGVKYHTEKEGQ